MFLHSALKALLLSFHNAVRSQSISSTDVNIISQGFSTQSSSEQDASTVASSSFVSADTLTTSPTSSSATSSTTFSPTSSVSQVSGLTTCPTSGLCGDAPNTEGSGVQAGSMCCESSSTIQTCENVGIQTENTNLFIYTGNALFGEHILNNDEGGIDLASNEVSDYSDTYQYLWNTVASGSEYEVFGVSNSGAFLIMAYNSSAIGVDSQGLTLGTKVLLVSTDDLTNVVLPLTFTLQTVSFGIFGADRTTAQELVPQSGLTFYERNDPVNFDFLEVGVY